MNKIKVISLTFDLPNKGGIGRVVYSLQEQFNSQKEIENTVLFVNNYDSIGLKVLKKFFKKPINNKNSVKQDKVISINIKENIFYKLLPQKYFRKHVQNYICKNININDFDIIHGHFFSNLGIDAIMLANKYKKKSVVTFHGSDTLNLKNIDILDKCNYVTFVSEFIKGCVLKVKSLKCPYKIINNGIDNKVFNLTNGEGTRENIVFAGRLNKIKGTDNLKEIFSSLYKDSDFKNYSLEIYGDGEEKEELEHYFKSKNIEVKFYGFLNEVELAKKFNNTKILIMPSLREGYPCIISEAKACGVYVIATDVGGVSEAIGKKGVLVKRDEKVNQNIVSSAKYILKLNYSTKEISEDLENSWFKLAEKYTEIYIKLKNIDD